MPCFYLKIWHIEQTCVFELSWGQGQQLTAKLPFSHVLKTHYLNWQRAYMDFYKSKEFQQLALRARVEMSGSIAPPNVDWRVRLAQSEAELMTEFHHWLSSAELLKIRREIAAGSQKVTSTAHDTTPITQINVFLTCDSIELERLPWETWEIGTEFATTKTIRLVRTPANIRAETGQRHRSGKMRILAILGDDTGLNFQIEHEALKSLESLAEVTFIGWQVGKETHHLLDEIQQAIVDPKGWDILFFAGHSNETKLTGGELMIAPNQSILVSEIAPQLLLAKERGLQFAIFNSCQGLSIANSLIDLGLGQVAIMREPIHNRVAQEFLVRFLRQMAAYYDVQDALRLTCQSFKLDKNLTYPSAYLVPSLFRHPDSQPFQLKPFGWRDRLKQWLPTRSEAIALSALFLVSLPLPVQDWLLAQRVLAQARYRHWTGQLATAPAPILLVQIDDASIQKAGIANPRPMRRSYLADLVNQLTKLNASVVGIDYLLDRPHSDDRQLHQAVQSSVQKQGTWFVFGTNQNAAGQWLTVLPAIADPNWSLSGDIWVPLWQVRPLPWDSSPPPFSYLLATAHRLNIAPAASLALPQPSQQSQQSLLTQVQNYARTQAGQSLVTSRMSLHQITAFSYGLRRRWLQPILDFSIPPRQVYQTVPAWQLLEQPDRALKLTGLASLRSAIVIIAAGGYSEAGQAFDGEDNFPLPPAVAYWRNQQQPPDENRGFTGGEAHAYMTQHFLSQRLVVPIPDLWMMLAMIPLGKALSLLMAHRRFRHGLAGLIGATIAYGLMSLQLYLTIAILLPWLLPAAVIWVYGLLTWKRFVKPL